MKYGDVIVLAVIVSLTAVWLWLRFKRWLYEPISIRLPVPYKPPASNEVTELLRQEGYEVLAGKQRIPIEIDVDGKKLSSRYFVDYFAKSDGELYVVKVSRERQKVSWTGSGVRDLWLPYFLIFEEVSGVLYVDMEKRKVSKMKIKLDLMAGNEA